MGFPGGTGGKEPACKFRKHKGQGFDPQVRKISWRRVWQPSQDSCLENAHGQRSLAGYSPWVCKGWTQLKQMSIPNVWKWKSLGRVWLCDPMDYTVHGILQARILEWVAVPFSRGSSQPRDWTQVSCLAGGFFTSWATRTIVAQIVSLFPILHPSIIIQQTETLAFSLRKGAFLEL